MNTFAIHNLWPVTIYQGTLDVKKECIDYSLKCDYERMISENGHITKNKYVLNDLPDLKKELNIHIENYLKKYLKVNNKLNFYFLNSWIVKHLPNDFAQQHCHGNSLISGVLYLNVPENSGDIKFHKSYSYQNLFHQSILIDFEEYNYTNAETWTVKSQKNSLLLFPSFLEHSVTKNLSNENRYSLAFNLFVKGKIGKNEYQLNLNNNE
jgi:uncharacterized protein (TIGR02466 family)